MLTTARDLVREQGVISLQEVAFKLGVPSQVARTMLQKWVAKGRIERLPTAAACSSCALCDSAPRELYRWREVADSNATSASSAPQSAAGCSNKVPTDCRASNPSQGQE